MTYLFPSRNWPGSDPGPNEPTLQEIQYAEALRRRLELQLLPAAELPARSFAAAEYHWAALYKR